MADMKPHGRPSISLNLPLHKNLGRLLYANATICLHQLYESQDCHVVSPSTREGVELVNLLPSDMA